MLNDIFEKPFLEGIFILQGNGFSIFI